MSQIKVEPYDPTKHRNYIWGVGDNVEAKSMRHNAAPTLAAYNVCIVTVCRFTFVFHDAVQLEACLQYYRRKHHPSGRLPVYTQNLGGDHGETQRWFEMLPQYLLEKSRRPKIVAALEKAKIVYEKAGG